MIDGCEAYGGPCWAPVCRRGMTSLRFGWHLHPGRAVPGSGGATPQTPAPLRPSRGRGGDPTGSQAPTTMNGGRQTGCTPRSSKSVSIDTIGKAILAEPVLHVDETGWRMMGAEKPKWAVWGLTAPTLAWYHLASSKSTKAAVKILRGYHGTLVVDGFAVYPKLRREFVDNELRIAHCWAHVLRKFRDNAKDPPDRIDEILTLIGKLYKVEREIEGPFPGDSSAREKRHDLRQENSRPLIRKIRDWAYAQGGLRRSAFAQAVAYMLDHWDGLTVFLDDPRVPLDNNAAERILRGVVVGRKNYYGTRSKRGAKVASILYTLIETAKLQGIEPRSYLHKAARAAIERPGAVTQPS